MDKKVKKFTSTRKHEVKNQSISYLIWCLFSGEVDTLKRKSQPHTSLPSHHHASVSDDTSVSHQDNTLRRSQRQITSRSTSRHDNCDNELHELDDESADREVQHYTDKFNQLVKPTATLGLRKRLSIAKGSGSKSIKKSYGKHVRNDTTEINPIDTNLGRKRKQTTANEKTIELHRTTPGISEHVYGVNDNTGISEHTYGVNTGHIFLDGINNSQPSYNQSASLSTCNIDQSTCNIDQLSALASTVLAEENSTLLPNTAEKTGENHIQTSQIIRLPLTHGFVSGVNTQLLQMPNNDDVTAVNAGTQIFPGPSNDDVTLTNTGTRIIQFPANDDGSSITTNMGTRIIQIPANEIGSVASTGTQIIQVIPVEMFKNSGDHNLSVPFIFPNNQNSQFSVPVSMYQNLTVLVQNDPNTIGSGVFQTDPNSTLPAVFQTDPNTTGPVLIQSDANTIGSAVLQTDPNTTGPVLIQSDANTIGSTVLQTDPNTTVPAVFQTNENSLASFQDIVKQSDSFDNEQINPSESVLNIQMKYLNSNIQLPMIQQPVTSNIQVPVAEVSSSVDGDYDPQQASVKFLIPTSMAMQSSSSEDHFIGTVTTTDTLPHAQPVYQTTGTLPHAQPVYQMILPSVEAVDSSASQVSPKAIL